MVANLLTDLRAEWESDPEFKALPDSEKRSIFESFFDKEVADQDFFAIPEEEQRARKDNFLSQLGFKEKPPLTLERVGGALKEGVKDVTRSTMQALSGIAETGIPEVLQVGAEAVFPPAAALRMIPKETRERAAGALKEAAVAPEFQTAPEFQGESSGWIEDFARSAPQMGTQIIATLAGGPLAGMGLMGLQIVGGTYDEAVKAGTDPGKAIGWGIANAIVQAPLEQLGVSKISKLWKPQQSLIAKLKEIGEAAGTEWLTEFMQQPPDSFTHIFATNPDKATIENLNAFVDKFGENIKEGAYQGTLTAPWALLGAAGMRRQNVPRGKPTPSPDIDWDSAIAKAREAYNNKELNANQIEALKKQAPPVYALELDAIINDHIIDRLGTGEDPETVIREETPIELVNQWTRSMGEVEDVEGAKYVSAKKRPVEQRVTESIEVPPTETEDMRTPMAQLTGALHGKKGRWVDERGGLIEETGPTREMPKVEPSVEVEPTETPQMGVEKEPKLTPVIVANGKIFRGKTHGDAINEALESGDAIRDKDGYLVDKEGNDIWRNGAIDLFETSDGELINRFQALGRYNITSAEDMIPPGEPAPAAPPPKPETKQVEQQPQPKTELMKPEDYAEAEFERRGIIQRNRTDVERKKLFAEGYAKIESTVLAHKPIPADVGRYYPALLSKNEYALEGDYYVFKGKTPKPLPPAKAEPDAILKGITSLQRPGQPRELVSTEKLRDKFPDLSKEEFDKAVFDLAKQDRVALHHHDFPSSLTPEKREKMPKDDRGKYVVGVVPVEKAEKAKKEKEPWEMKRDDVVWEGYIPDGASTDRALAGRLARWEKIKREAKSIHIESVEQAIAKEKARIARANSHRAAVKQALSEGKPVPKRVIDDYPDLAPKPTEKAEPESPITPKAVKGIYYFRNRKHAELWAEANGWPSGRIIQYTRGFAVQERAGGRYAGPNQVPEGKPEVKAEEQSKEAKPGRAWIKDQWRPITSARELSKGKKKGWVEVESRGKKYVIDKSKVKEWPGEEAKDEFKAGDIITDGLVNGKVISEGSMKMGKKELPAYKVEVLTGKEKGKTSLILKDQAKPVEQKPEEVKAQIEGIEQTPEFKDWFKGSQVVDESGKPKIVYSGHANVLLYGKKFEPRKATAGAFYATEDPDVASGYSTGKLGIKEYFENGEQYKLKNPKTGQFTKKVWQYQLSPEQLNRLEEMKQEKDEDGEFKYEISEMDRWIQDNKKYDKDAARMAWGGSKRLENIWKFYEYMGYTIAYAKEGEAPYFARQQKNRFENLLDDLGIEWTSYDWNVPGVMPVYLKITNPIDASKAFPRDLLDALDKASKYEHTRSSEYIDQTHWTRDYPLKEWVKDIKRTEETGKDAFWATQVPSKAKPIIKRFGYDGIRDIGGKSGEQKHAVWIALDPIQVKSAYHKGPYDERLKADRPTLTRTLSFEDLNRHVDRIVKPWKAGPLVNAVEDYANIPEDIRDVAEERFAKADLKGLKALFVKYSTGKPVVYLIGNRLSSTQDAETSILHEVFGHYGPRIALDDKELNQFYKGVYFAKTRQVKAMVEEFPAYKWDPKKKTGYNLDTPEGRMKAADEWFAREVAEKGIEQDPWLKRQWDRFVQILNDALRALGFQVKLSDSEIRQVLRASVKAVTEGPSKGIQVSSVSAAFYHGTPSVNLEKIKRQGLWSNLRERNDWEEGDRTPREQELIYFETAENQNWGGKKSVQLRIVDEDMLPRGVRIEEDQLRPGEFYAYHVKNEPFEIPPEAIEYFDTKTKEWKALVEPAEISGMIEPVTKKGEGQIPTGKTPKAEGGKILYHGSPSKFDRLEIGKPSPRDSRYTSAVIALTDDPKYAKRYAGKTGTISEVRVDLKNPIDLGNGESTMTIATFLEKIGSPQTAEELNLNPTGWVEQWRMVSYNPDIVKILQDQGYDGAIWKENKGKSTTYAAFSDEQIIPNLTGPREGGPDIAASITETKLEFLREEDGEKMYRAVSGPFKGGVFTEEMARDEGFKIPGEKKPIAKLDLKAGDVVSFRAPDGHIVNGKVRDIDHNAKQVWVFHRESELYDSPEAASTKVPFDKIVPAISDISASIQSPEEWAKQFVSQFQKAPETKAEEKFDEEHKEDTLQAFETFGGFLKARKRGWKPQKEDTHWLHRIFSVPLHHFRKVPALGRLFQDGLNRMDNYYSYLNTLTQGPDKKYHTVTIDNFRKQDGEGFKKFQKYLVDRDRNQIGFEVKKNKQDEYELYLGQVKKGTYATEEEAWEGAIQKEVATYREKHGDQAADALLAFRRITHNGFRILMKNMRDTIEKFEANGIPLPEVAIKVEGGKTAKVDLKMALAKMGDMRGYYFPRIRKAGQYMLTAKKEGANPIMEFFDTETFLTRRQIDLEKQGYTVTKDLSPKMPEDVFQMAGEVIAMQATINSALERIHTEGLTLENFGLEFVDRTVKGGTRDFVVRGPSSKRMNEVFKDFGGKWYAAFAGEERMWHFINPGRDFQKRLSKALANQVGILDQETDLLFAKTLAEQVANVIKARGHRAHMIERSDAKGLDVWTGYEEDPALAIAQYARGISAGEAKKNMALDMVKHFTGTDISWAEYKQDKTDAGEEPDYEEYAKTVNERRIHPTKQPNAFKEGKVFMEDMLRNQEHIDRVMGIVKGLSVLKYLGFRVAAPAVNLTALATSAPAAISGYTKTSIPSAMLNIGKAAKVYTQYLLDKKGKGLISKQHKELFEEIEDKGWDKAQYNREALSVLESRVGRHWGNLIEWSMWMFGKTEQLNRVSTIAGAYFAIKDSTPANEFVHETAIEKAKDISDKSHGVYNRANMPHWARGGGIAPQIAKSFYIFKTFSHNYLLTMKDLGLNEKQAGAALYMAISPMILAGSGALVGKQIITAIMESLGIGGDDPEETLYQWVYDNAGERGERLVRHGLFGVPGVNLKGSLEIGITDIPTSIADVLGAPGSLFEDLYYGGKSLARGDIMKGLEKMPFVPNALGSISRAVRERTEGVTTGTNAPVFYGTKPLVSDTVEAIYRGLSFNPSRIAGIREKQWKEREIEQKYSKMRTDIYAKAKRFYLKPSASRNQAEWIDILNEMNEYNERVMKNKLNRKGIPIMTGKMLNNNIRRAFKPSKRERLREVEEETED